MSTTTRRLPDHPRIGSLTAAFALTVGGTLAGLVGAIAVQALFGVAGWGASDVAYVVRSRGVQVGFGLFALGYLAVTDGWARYWRFRRPTVRDAAWVALAGVGFYVSAGLAAALIEALGLPAEAVVGSGGRSLALASRPELWPVVVVAWFVIATPLEELFFRGLVQTRLRTAFGPVPTVAVAAALFSLTHVFFSLTSGAGATTMATTGIEVFAGGLVFTTVYERTDNLLTVAVIHGLTWIGAYDAVAHALPTLA